MFSTEPTMSVSPRSLFLVLASTTALLSSPAAQQPANDARQAAVRSHVRAIEGVAGGTLDDALAQFERDHFASTYVASTSPATRRDLLASVRAATTDVDNVRVMQRDGAYILMLGGSSPHEVTFTIEPAPPYRLASLSVRRTAAEARPAPLTLTPDTLAATFDRLEQDGFSGAVFVQLDGLTRLERAFGAAHRGPDTPVRLDTIFGTGSRPIDYTVAAILLLDQKGQLRLDDTIDRHLGDVPADKRAMTIRHLANGQSGLPDFIHTPDDWNADLAWIDRATLERRLLAAPLRFAPGADRAPSHAAFGLLAAIVERVSGQSYASFLRQHFFEPAGMTRTGFYGDSLGLPLTEFAVGGGPEVVGAPNIPPNWGPTSWLVMGSGGMYSTLPDLRRFYAFVRSGTVLDDAHATRFRNTFASLDGSDRGFELFHVYEPSGNEVILLLNMSGHRPDVRQLVDGLARLARPGVRGD
jgi:CubicO group peptidase (beta-lactamase class C family)